MEQLILIVAAILYMTYYYIDLHKFFLSSVEVDLDMKKSIQQNIWDNRLNKDVFFKSILFFGATAAIAAIMLNRFSLTEILISSVIIGISSSLGYNCYLKISENRKK